MLRHTGMCRSNGLLFHCSCMYVHDNKQKNSCLWNKEMMDNNIYGNSEKCCSVVVITIMFLSFDVKV